MTTFADETAVRERLQLPEAVPSEAIDTALEDAHDAVTARLDPETTLEPVPEGLRLGEALLAGAALFRSMAAREAYEQRRIAVGGGRIEESGRRASLEATADSLEERAWRLMAPYLQQPPPRILTHTTPTQDL